MDNNLLNTNIEKAVDLILKSKRTTAFTGAGISVESGIPPFRGENGLWSKFNPEFLDINYFHSRPEQSWKLIKHIFYDFFGKAKPNHAHKALCKLEQMGLLQSIITQNIDGLHQEAGSNQVYEFHGNSRDLICTKCSKIHKVENVNMDILPPKCTSCGSLLKPDFIFFGEQIPEPAQSNSYAEIYNADVFLVIGTTGEIMPASNIPIEAYKNGKTIIEINIEPSNYTNIITNIFLQGKATEIMNKIIDKL
ncbi:MAG: NAD-dependent deacylase [Bacteroidota bacterium]|nr:NAD-dependent deacylase [Bacteroidota bacterium]